ncbi:nucleotidyltransferase [Sesbania bispinosa]|nr:nucleotidyltransferase [Sesbania bispinosa]
MARMTSVPRTYSFRAPTDSPRTLQRIQHGRRSRGNCSTPGPSKQLIIPKGPNSGSRGVTPPQPYLEKPGFEVRLGKH